MDQREKIEWMDVPMQRYMASQAMEADREVYRLLGLDPPYDDHMDPLEWARSKAATED